MDDNSIYCCLEWLKVTLKKNLQTDLPTSLFFSIEGASVSFYKLHEGND